MADYEDYSEVESDLMDDGFYSDDNDLEGGDYDGEGYNSFAEIDDDQNPLAYAVLSEEDIRQRQEDDIATLTSVLSISKAEATILLLHFNWDVTKANEEWFGGEEGTRETVGLLKEQVNAGACEERIFCRICLEYHLRDKVTALFCGHPFCNNCWGCYIETKISDGLGCLMVRCPEPSCSATVGRDMVDRLVLDEEKNKYYRYFLRSYVESNNRIKWCPAPDCEFAIELASVCPENFDVSCSCAHSFCWNCSEEPHRPVDCLTVAKWVSKNSQESENVTWIIAKTKPCPKCCRPIEKNDGCMHMTCREPCKYQFCWLCLGPWASHSFENGGYYSCNRFEEAKRTGAYVEAEAIRERAKKSVERYTHYYERWAVNESSRQTAVRDLRKVEETQIDVLSAKYGTPVSQLKFLEEAWRQIEKGRRVLKWTYAYGYYWSPKLEKEKRELFEFSQGEAEAGLEKLHHCAEKELLKFLEVDMTEDQFHDFRKKLEGLTKASQVYFTNLIRAVENGLAGG